MSSTDIGWAGLAASLVLVAVAVGLSGWQRLHLSRSILWACARAAVQLFIVGWALKLVLDPDASVAWAWLWVAVMVTLRPQIGTGLVRDRPSRRRTVIVVLGVWLAGRKAQTAS